MSQFSHLESGFVLLYSHENVVRINELMDVKHTEEFLVLNKY